jgi:5-oxoprolinase (ATP-hydrolysing)
VADAPQVIQPVFDDDGKEIVFWVAARGHHTDIGGLGGNSGHPNQTERWEEGVAFDSTFIVRDGVFNESEIVETFMQAGTYPGCKATKRIDHNISDLKAQCSACAVGTAQLHALFDEYGKAVVHFYMKGEPDPVDRAAPNSPCFSHSRQRRRLHPRRAQAVRGQNVSSH